MVVSSTDRQHRFKDYHHSVGYYKMISRCVKDSVWVTFPTSNCYAMSFGLPSVNGHFLSFHHIRFTSGRIAAGASLIRQTNMRIKTWISNYINLKQWYVTSNPWPGLVELSLTSGFIKVITSHMNLWVDILVHSYFCE